MFGPVDQPFRRRLVVVAAVGFAVVVITGPANSFLYVYVLALSGAAIAAIVATAGIAGLEKVARSAGGACCSSGPVPVAARAFAQGRRRRLLVGPVRGPSVAGQQPHAQT